MHIGAGAAPGADPDVDAANENESVMTVPRHFIVHPTAGILPDHPLWFVNKDSRATMKRLYAKWDAEMRHELSDLNAASFENFESFEDDEQEDTAAADTGTAGSPFGPPGTGDSNGHHSNNSPLPSGGGFSCLVQMLQNDPEKLAQFNEEWKEARWRVLHAFDGVASDLFLLEEQALVDAITDMAIRM